MSGHQYSPEIKVEQLMSLLSYTKDYRGRVGYNDLRIDELKSTVLNAGFRYSLQEMSDLKGPWVDDALRQTKAKVESNPEILKAILDDADTFLKSGKENVDLKSGRALQELGYPISNRADYIAAVNDLNFKINLVVKSEADLASTSANAQPQASVVLLNFSYVEKFNRASGAATINYTRQFNISSGAAAGMKNLEPAPVVTANVAEAKVSVPSPQHEDSAPSQEDSSYSTVDWSRIQSVPVTEGMKHTLRMVAGVSDEAARKGVLDIADDGHIVLIRKTGEGDTAKIVAHDVTSEIDNIPGLGEVPLSQKDFKMAADAFREAKAMDGFDPKAGIKVHGVAEIEGWGSLNDKKYDFWARQAPDGRIQIGLVTEIQRNMNSDILSKAEIQISALDQFRAAYEFDIEKPVATLKT